MRHLTASLFIVAALSAEAGAAPAARAGDPTSHGGLVVTGSPNVLIGGLPAARHGDNATCPIVEGNPPVAHVGGPIVALSSTVLVNGVPAARSGDQVVEAAGPGSVIVGGSGTVLIGATAARAPRAPRRSRPSR